MLRDAKQRNRKGWENKIQYKYYSNVNKTYLMSKKQMNHSNKEKPNSLIPVGTGFIFLALFLEKTRFLINVPFLSTGPQ